MIFILYCPCYVWNFGAIYWGFSGEKKSHWRYRGLESSQKEMYQILYTWQGYCYTKCYCYFSCQILVPFIPCIAASSSIIPNSVIPSAKTSNWTVSQPRVKRVKSVIFHSTFPIKSSIKLVTVHLERGTLSNASFVSLWLTVGLWEITKLVSTPPFLDL